MISGSGQTTLACEHITSDSTSSLVYTPTFMHYVICIDSVAFINFLFFKKIH